MTNEQNARNLWVIRCTWGIALFINRDNENKKYRTWDGMTYLPHIHLVVIPNFRMSNKNRPKESRKKQLQWIYTLYPNSSLSSVFSLYILFFFSVVNGTFLFLPWCRFYSFSPPWPRVKLPNYPFQFESYPPCPPLACLLPLSLTPPLPYPRR